MGDFILDLREREFRYDMAQPPEFLPDLHPEVHRRDGFSLALTSADRWDV
jgi:hypothetical protein